MFGYSRLSQLPQRVSFPCLQLWHCTNGAKDREEALKDDYPLDGETYDDDEDDEWAGDDTAWNDENEPEDETDAKDESTAYLEFLNEEVSFDEAFPLYKSLINFRHKSSRISRTTIRMMN